MRAASEVSKLCFEVPPLPTRPHGRLIRRVFLPLGRRRRRRGLDVFDFVPGVESYPYDMLVELHAEAGRVRMVLTADRHPDPEMTRGAVLALTTQLERFERAIAARASKEQRP